MSPGLFNGTASSAARPLVDRKVLKYRAVLKKQTGSSAFAAVVHKTKAKTKKPCSEARCRCTLLSSSCPICVLLLLIKTAADCRLHSPH